MAEVNKILSDIKMNLTENVTDTLHRTPATPEGMAVAYISIIIMAILPIFFGSMKSVKYHKEMIQFQKVMRKKNYCLSGLTYICSIRVSIILSKLLTG